MRCESFGGSDLTFDPLLQGYLGRHTKKASCLPDIGPRGWNMKTGGLFEIRLHF